MPPAIARRPSARRPPVASYLLSAAPTPLSVRSFVSWRGSVAHSPPSLSLSPLVRSLVRPLSPIIVARSFARSLRSSLSPPSISLPSFVHSNRVECRSFLTLCAGKLKHFRQNFEGRTHFAPIPTRMSCRPPSYLHVERGTRCLGTFIICPPASAVNRGCGIERTNETRA